MSSDEIRIFIDFGSTFTKAVAFDLSDEVLLARAQAPSTVDTDVMLGLKNALASLSKSADINAAHMRNALACSSAAGGLRMVCVGLVTDYTTKAGQMAALGAGAKVVGTFSYELSKSELSEISALRPDIILLTGGTDGGNKKVITSNAESLASIKENLSSVIVAGNKSAYDDVEAAFNGTGLDLSFTGNVMPEFGQLELDLVNDKIRELFIRRITEAKGISRASDIISGVIMPTPSAVLNAAILISSGTKSELGLGDLMMIDVGGATTDIYSIASGKPTRDNVHTAGLREPHAKRTVEGDLGLYHSLDSLAGFYDDAAPGDLDSIKQSISDLHRFMSIPADSSQKSCQLALSRLAVKTAVSRHAGYIEAVPTVNGDVLVQRGKDLSNIETVIGAGGPLAFSSEPRHVLEGAIADPAEPLVLKPASPVFLLDEKYILFAIGLLGQSEPDIALRIIRKYLKRI